MIELYNFILKIMHIVNEYYDPDLYYIKLKYKLDSVKEYNKFYYNNLNQNKLLLFNSNEAEKLFIRLVNLDENYIERKYNKDIKIEFIDSGKFEGRLQIAGDVLLFVMHTNIFEFPKEHPIMKSSYMKENNLRSFCGIIYVYNFLADTFKYNRTNDLGYLIARIFVNKDFHFIVEGKRQMEFLCNSFGNQVIDNLALKKILETAVEYCLDFDLLLPPYDNVKEVNFGDMQEYSSNMSLKTGKRLGFRFQADPEETL